MIELEHLSKTFSDFLAVDDLSLRVRRGEIFGFIGPNGAGKTTTIKMIGGIIAPSAGRVAVCGIDMAADPVAAKHKIGFIPDRPFLYEKLTAREFLKFTSQLYRVNENHFDAKAEDMLTRFSLLDWSDDLIESYSHGMKQRLVMAAALLHDPEVIVVDEPMVGLDPVAIIMVKDLFRQLAAQGVSIFMSTHTLKVAEDVCDRIGIINRGRLVATGTLADLKAAARAGELDLEGVFLKLSESQFKLDD